MLLDSRPHKINHSVSKVILGGLCGCRSSDDTRGDYVKDLDRDYYIDNDDSMDSLDAVI